MTGVSGLGPWPGQDVLHAQLQLLEDFSNQPYGVTAKPFLVQLAGRGPGADLMGRTLALLDGLPTELGPHGWKLAAHSGRDLERAQSFLAQDLEALGIAASGLDGPLCLDLVGPWTLASQLYLATGDRVLTDQGAVAELAHALTEAAAQHVDQVAQRVPGAQITVRFDETSLAQVGAGVLPTFSGYSRIKAVPGPTLVERLKPLMTRVNEHAATVVRVGYNFAAVAPAVLSGATGLGLDFGPHNGQFQPQDRGFEERSWNEQGWELLAQAHERGVHLWAGLPAPHFSQCSGPNLDQLARLVTVGWTRMGLPVSDLDTVTVTPSKPNAHAAYREGPKAVAAGLTALTRVAERLAEKAAE